MFDTLNPQGRLSLSIRAVCEAQEACGRGGRRVVDRMYDKTVRACDNKHSGTDDWTRGVAWLGAGLGGFAGRVVGLAGGLVLGPATFLNPAERLMWNGNATWRREHAFRRDQPRQCTEIRYNPAPTSQAAAPAIEASGAPIHAPFHTVPVECTHHELTCYWRHGPSGALFDGEDVAPIRQRCLLLAVLHPLMGLVVAAETILLPLLAACRLVRPPDEGFAKALQRALLAVPAYVMLEVAALVGILCPLTGRRAWSTLQRALPMPIVESFGVWADERPVATISDRRLPQ